MSSKGPSFNFLILCNKLDFQKAQRVPFFTISKTLRLLSLTYSANFRRSRRSIFRRSLVQTASTSHKFLLAAKQMIFVDLSSKLSCIRTSLISLNFIKLFKKYIINLAEIWSHDIVRVSLRSSSFKIQPRPYQFHQFNAYRLAPRLKPLVATIRDTLGLPISFPPMTTGETPVEIFQKF